MRFTYEGERVPDFILITVYEGWNFCPTIPVKLKQSDNFQPKG